MIPFWSSSWELHVPLQKGKQCKGDTCLFVLIFHPFQPNPSPPHKLSNIALERQVKFQFTPLVTIQQNCIHYDHFFLHSRSNPLCYTQTPQQTWRASFFLHQIVPLLLFRHISHTALLFQKNWWPRTTFYFSTATASTPLWRAKPTV